MRDSCVCGLGPALRWGAPRKGRCGNASSAGDVDDIATNYSTERQAAKAVTFGIMYGAGANKISQQVTQDSGKYFSVITTEGRPNNQEISNAYTAPQGFIFTP